MPRVSAITNYPAIGGIPRGSMLAFGMRKKFGAGTEYGFTDFGVGFYTEAHPMAGTYQRRVTGYNNHKRHDTKRRQTYYVQMRDCRSSNPKTPKQQKTRENFREAMRLWRELPPETKKEYNRKGSKISRYGMHVFLRETMRKLNME